ncbi:high affinity immunoglobulin alpha and immunoglobulin mu Fc receptor isoform X2 [Vombatus ursinus]|uniref:high affinity immunoglobulin alpha and immunoglobulin mu Fc receptor isoform X2 n=1 Tax=Vombatus ursinus TaxID=29139 RepID=UPI000FFCF247|nr:high affinity immunoglobulin alpha and immunoglobulin mu Fc receptor isoform X2 [Vombatus ursinus]
MENTLIQPTGQGGTYLRAGWKMIPLFILCLLQDTSALKGPRLVAGDPGGTVTIKCHYIPTPVNKYQRKYWCRLYPPQRICHTVISTNFFIRQSYRGRVTLVDFPNRGMFEVTLAQLTSEDAGYYRCGIGRRTDTFFFSMNLTISTAQANRSLDSSILRIPSSIIPMTAQATRGQTINTTLLVEGWETRTSRRGTTPAEVTQAPGTIEVTTTVTGGQDLDTTLLIEEWETRTKRKDITPGEIHRGSTGVTAPGVDGWVPKTIETTASAPGSQVFDATLVIKGHGAGNCSGHITPNTVAKTSGTLATIISVAGRRGPGTLGRTILAAGRQDLDTSLVAKGQGAGISRGDPALIRVTQLPAQASSKNLQPPAIVRLTSPGTGDWGLETTRAANLVPERQTSGAKVTSSTMEGGLVLGTRAVTKTVGGTIRERKLTIRSTHRLTEGTVNIGIPQITTRNSPGTMRPSTTVRDSLREVTPGTDQQIQEVTRATAPDADVGAWFSGTIRKGEASVLEGTAAIGRESHSEEPLRIPGAALLIPPSKKPFMENSSPDQKRVSQILITLSTVLLPLVLLVLLLLLRKLRKRICKSLGSSCSDTEAHVFPNPAN